MKGYPRSRFEINDLTQIPEIASNVKVNPAIVLMTTYTSDKGDEQWKLFDNLTDFTNRTGGFSWDKHGLPQLLVGEMLRSGAVVFSKRLVSEDALLANITVRARLVADAFNTYAYFYTVSSTDAVTFKEACDFGYDNFDIENSELTIPKMEETTPEEVSNAAYAIIADKNGAEDVVEGLTCEIKTKINDVYQVVIYATKLKKHTNGEDKEGYWCGLGLLPPNGEDKFKWKFGVDAKAFKEAELSEATDLEKDVHDGQDGFALYYDVEKYRECYVGVQWVKSEDESESELFVYKVDCSNVVLDGIDNVEAVALKNKINTIGTPEASEDPEEDDVNYDDVSYVDVPLFTVTPQGRGSSALSFRIVPEYFASRASEYSRFTFEVYDYAERVESIAFTINPDIVIEDISQSMQYKINASSTQVRLKFYEDGLLAYIRALAKVATLDGDLIQIPDLINMDIINGTDRRGTKQMGGVIFSDNTEDLETLWSDHIPAEIADSICNLNNPAGIYLANGSYGAMGAKPIKNQEEYTKLLLAAYGKNRESMLFDPIIYDLDAYKIEAVFDCSYPTEVKNAIVDLVDFRGDCVFLADLGTNNYTLQNIITAASNITPSRNCAIYHNFFNVINPYTKKEITVTMPYLLASRLVTHFNNGVGRPFAGLANEIYFPEIIENTINFIPVVIPGEDQKQMLVDNNINYLAYYDGTPVMDTMYTNQIEYTQLSFLSNIMGVQEIIKVIRARCPRTRYTFLDGTDLEDYIEDVTAIINNYSTFFKSITVEYMADEMYEQNNIFYATLRVRFRNFIQEELFRIIAIN